MKLQYFSNFNLRNVNTTHVKKNACRNQIGDANMVNSLLVEKIKSEQILLAVAHPDIFPSANNPKNATE